MSGISGAQLGTWLSLEMLIRNPCTDRIVESKREGQMSWWHMQQEEITKEVWYVDNQNKRF